MLIGLILGLVGDVFLNLRNQVTGGKSMKIFAVGILAFLSGHFLYIAALIGRSPAIILPALIATAVLSALAIPPLMKRITAPSAGLKIFGYVYLVVVIAMFSCAAALLVTLGAGALTLADGAFPAIPAEKNLAIRYKAKVSASEAVTNINAATIVFTIAAVNEKEAA